MASGTEANCAEHRKPFRSKSHTELPKESRNNWITSLRAKKHYTWSRDAEANDMIHMGSDQKSVMARLVK